MKTIKCDRCKQFKDKGYVIKLPPKEVTEKMAWAFENKDMCESCLESLFEFMNPFVVGGKPSSNHD